ncbi:antitoxin MazE family protein [Paraburkholderia hospita]|uniref:antitoxin MazE family protein n=1 Tax=Paraburkholderia hospita TaxID=169430 RepID=UPI003ED1663A
MTSSREKRRDLRRAGLRPITIWVPDTRAPGFAEECRRQSRLWPRASAKRKTWTSSSGLLRAHGNEVGRLNGVASADHGLIGARRDLRLDSLYVGAQSSLHVMCDERPIFVFRFARSLIAD